MLSKQGTYTTVNKVRAGDNHGSNHERNGLHSSSNCAIPQDANTQKNQLECHKGGHFAFNKKLLVRTTYMYRTYTPTKAVQNFSVSLGVIGCL